ncbi:TetR/AcrR family transcriptional regulator [Agromyces sp. NPDC049794]|uniref:TetR/AcrR family transcriptional regulator n=1 Tax=unclassified Agromyces TaxID=2639701 RepID=UPI0033D19250
MDDAILGAALQLFIEEGPDGATIERIAARAGVTRPTVYRRWRDKDALLVDAIARVRERAERPLGHAAAMSVDDVLAWMTDAIPRELAQPASRTLLARLIGAAPDRPELIERYWTEVLGPRWSAFGALMEESSRGSAADAALLSDVVGGALVWRVLVRPGETSEAELRDFLVEVLGLLGLQGGRS